jgi:hypothetical protein
MHTNEREGEIRVELYERSELPPPARRQVDAVHSRLDTLAEKGELSTVTREDWVKRTPLHDCDAELRDTYLTFSSWATENDVRLTPFFQTRECFSPSVEDYTDWLVFPAFCLAVYEDGSLSAVYPHADEEETQTVQDGVESLLLDEKGEVAPGHALAD